MTTQVNHQLPPDHYLVSLTYAPFPSFRELKNQYGDDKVEGAIDGCSFENHPSRQGMDKTPGEKVFWVATLPYEFFIARDSSAWEKEIIAWAEKQRTKAAPNGYLPATHQEWYEFKQAHSLLWLVALGSFVLLGAHRWHVAVCNTRGVRLVLDANWFDGYWSNEFRFLFVPKPV